MKSRIMGVRQKIARSKFNLHERDEFLLRILLLLLLLLLLSSSSSHRILLPPPPPSSSLLLLLLHECLNSACQANMANTYATSSLYS
jgi:hypothetical protein